MTANELDNLARRIDVVSELDLFFIVGMHRSGTTWLQRLLNRHDRVSCRGEAHFIDILFTNLQKAFKVFNKEVRHQGGTVAHLKEFGGHVESLEYDTPEIQLMLYYGIYLMLIKWVDSDKIKVVGEKTPDNVLWMNLLATIFPDAKFLHVIRDGRDSAVSGWFFNLSEVDENKALVDTIETYVDRYMKQWSSAMQFARTIGNQNKERYMEIRYEDLSSDPEGTLTKACRFLGVNTSRQIIDECVSKESFEALSDGRTPGQEDRTSFFRKGLNGEWREHFDIEMAKRAWRVAGEQLSDLGYSKT